MCDLVLGGEHQAVRCTQNGECEQTKETSPGLEYTGSVGGEQEEVEEEERHDRRGELVELYCSL